MALFHMGDPEKAKGFRERWLPDAAAGSVLHGL